MKSLISTVGSPAIIGYGRDVPAFSVQYHPEAGPGPHDARYLFDDFLDLMRRGAKSKPPGSGRS